MSEIPSELSERFDVRESLPAGRSGQLFHVTEKTSNRRGVLKILDGSLTSSASDRQRIKRELAKQSTLGHSGLALPIITGEVGKTVWLFREWIDGQSLRQRLDDAGALSKSELLAATTEIAAALDELHRAGLLFRDLKPEHVIFRRDGRIALVDAGIAAPVRHDEVFDLHGTPAYLSPEQCKGKLVSFRSDLYALGCILYEMASGRPLFAGLGGTPELLEAHQSTEPPEAPPILPEEARNLVAQLLDKDPRKRPFSAQQVRRTLDPLLPEDLKSGEYPVGGGMGGKTSTLPGMPAVGSAPPRPPSMSKPPRPPSMNPTPPKQAKSNPDATQQVRLEDVIEQEPIKKSVPPPTPPEAVSKPPAPPSMSAKKDANTTQPIDALDIIDEEVAPAPAVAAAIPAVKESVPPPAEAVAEAAAEGMELLGEPAPSTETALDSTEHVLPPVEEFTEAAEAAMAGSSVDDLDYDEDAETIHRDAPSALMGMEPQPQAPQSYPAQPEHPPAYQDEAATTPGTQTSPGVAPAPVEQPVVQSVMPAQPDNRNGLYVMVGGGLVFLSVCLFIAYQIFSQSDEVALAPPAAAAPTQSEVVQQAQEQAQQLALQLAQAQQQAQPTVEQAAQPPGLENGNAEHSALDSLEAAEADEVDAADETDSADSADEADEEDEAEASSATSSMETRSTMRTSSMRTARAMGGGNSFDAIREQAREHFQARRYPQAAQAYQRATAINPRHAGSWSGLGAALMQTRDYRGAVQAYQRAVQLNPRSSGFFTSLGHALRLSGNTNGARQAYQRAVALNPGNRSAQQWLARL